MVANFSSGGAAINQIASVAGAVLRVVPLELERPTRDFTGGPAMDEAVEVLAEGGIHLDLLRVRGFPFHNDVRNFISEHDQVFVVEQNRDAQLRTLLVNELAPRPHNSFHASEIACLTSQFEQHVRSICDLPLGSVEVVRPAAFPTVKVTASVGATRVRPDVSVVDALRYADQATYRAKADGRNRVELYT